jgi:hypothetical protein
MADENDVHISLPPGIFVTVLVGALLGGGGLYGALGPHLDREAVTQCYNNSKIALDVAAQHGAEIQVLRELIYERTADRYSGADARKDWADQYRRDEQQDRRIKLTEDQLE